MIFSFSLFHFHKFVICSLGLQGLFLIIFLNQIHYFLYGYLLQLLGVVNLNSFILLWRFFLMFKRVLFFLKLHIFGLSLFKYVKVLICDCWIFEIVLYVALSDIYQTDWVMIFEAEKYVIEEYWFWWHELW